MNLWKRILSALLAGAMMLTLVTVVPVNASAASNSQFESFKSDLISLLNSQCSDTSQDPFSTSENAAFMAGNPEDAAYSTARLLVLAEANLNTKLIANATAKLYDGSGMWVVQFKTAAEAREAAETLKAHGIKSSPDVELELSAWTVSEDTTSATYLSWGVEACHYDTFISDNAGVLDGEHATVAVVDTGVDATHPFLTGKVVQGWDVTGQNGANPTKDHGTHVAGTIVDCCGSTDVTILNERAADMNNELYASAWTTGIKDAANKGADVINCSFGGWRSGDDGEVEKAAVQYAVDKGSLVVCSAGNDNENADGVRWHAPSHFATTVDGCMSIAAGDSNKNKAYFSNYGASIDLMAPGVSIKSTVLGGEYGTKNGTSMAAPHVCAAAALIKMASGEDSPAKLRQLLRKATTSGGTQRDDIYGYGFLDLSKLNFTPSPAPTPTLDPIEALMRQLKLQYLRSLYPYGNFVDTGSGFSGTIASMKFTFPY